MTPDFSLRAATSADLPFLIELRLATMVPHFARQGIALSPEEHRLRAAFRLDATRLIERASGPVGVIKVLREDGLWTVEQLQVASACQGRGIGAAVLRAVIAESVAAGAELRLSVLKQNPARHLYGRLGFKTLEESDTSYKMTWAAPTPSDV